MKKTIAQQRIEEMESQGYKLAGRTSGQPSMRKGSNLSKAIEALGLTPDAVIVKQGAHKQRGADGWELLIFTKK